jgi:penicillin-binding protein-related factor A (putative recombinase)
MQNEGKKFEGDFRDSVPDDTWYYRLRDGTASWGNDDSSKTRFQAENICDFELFSVGTLCLLELKSHMGKSLPHNQFMNTKGKIKHLPELAKALNFGIVDGAVINMREVGETYFLYADKVLDHIYNSGRKSIPVEYMRTYGYRLKAEQKRVRWRYDVKDLIEHIRLDR